MTSTPRRTGPGGPGLVLVLILVVVLTAIGPVAAGATRPCAGKRGAARAKCLRRTTTSTVAPTTTTRPAASAGAATPTGKAFPGNGSFAVGTDIRPGLYRSVGDPSDPAAGSIAQPYYERLDASGEIIDNGGPWWDGVAWVEILASDARFTTERFSTWEPVDPTRAKGPRETAFPGWDTCVLVGYDVAPGTYRATVDADVTALVIVHRRATYDADEIGSTAFVADGDEVRLDPAGRFFCSEGVETWTRVGG